MTVPNLLTLARLLLTPLIAVLAVSGSPAARLAAPTLFLFAMLTDVADGIIARRFNQGSLLGLYLDTVTDKLIILTMFFVLADLDRVPLWMALGMLAREIIVDGVRSAGAAQGRVVGANIMGKTKICLQTAAITLGLVLPLSTTTAAATRVWTTGATGVALAIAWVFAVVFLYWNRGLLQARATE
jgi:CDP-diacylglycerol--glycerol-3-phosphate 3-phosphatidyltransferase